MFAKLMKIFFKENLSLRRIMGTDFKKNKGKTILYIILLIYGLFSIIGTFGYMFYDLGKTLDSYGLINIILIYAFIYSTTLAIMFVLFRANGYLFNYKDYEFLEPLPIKTKTILYAKITIMMIFIYISMFLFITPILFSYFYFTEFNIIAILFVIIGFLAIPIFPLIIFSFISLLITRITSGFRKNNIINIILLFIVFVGIMYLSLSINGIGNNNPLLNQRGFLESLSKFYPPIKWFVNAVSNQDVVSLLLLTGTTAIAFFAFVIGIQKLVLTTNQRGLTKVTRISNKAVISKQTTLIQAIANKESKTFFSTPIYALNVGFGVIIIFVLAILSLFYMDKIETVLTSQIDLGFDYELIVLILIAFGLTMVYSTAISLSLEGKHLWIIKSLPISPKKVMYGKMLFNVYLGLPISIISLLIFSYSLDISFVRLLLMILVVISISLMVTTLGSVVNLYMPKFNWRNPTEVVKQSIGAVIGMFGSWTLLLIDGGLFYLLRNDISTNTGMILIFFINSIMTILFLYIVNKNSENLFMNYQA